MRTLRITVAFGALLLGLASTGRAQDGDATPLPLPSRSIRFEGVFLAPALALSGEDAAARAAEVERWMDEYTNWMEWSAKWNNKREPGLLTTYRDRQPRPDPPAWLPDRCDAVVDDNDPLAPACTLLVQWQHNDATVQGAAQAVATAQKEDERKTIWWEHIHADVLWPAMQWQASIYGVVGVHAATTVKGRFQIFVAPGAMLLTLPGRNGGRVWKFATNYGIGYRLADVPFPGDRQAVLHVNLAKAWLLSDITDVVASRSTDFVGFSLTFKKSE
jgi:hypothetical protein